MIHRLLTKGKSSPPLRGSSERVTAVHLFGRCKFCSMDMALIVERRTASLDPILNLPRKLSTEQRSLSRRHRRQKHMDCADWIIGAETGKIYANGTCTLYKDVAGAALSIIPLDNMSLKNTAFDYLLIIHESPAQGFFVHRINCITVGVGEKGVLFRIH